MKAAIIAKTLSWYRISLTRSEYESGEVAVLLGAFRAAYVSRNGPQGMAIFGCWHEDGLSYDVYATPSSVRHIAPLLEAYSAQAIATPDATGISLIYGDDSDLSCFEIGLEA